MYDHFEETLGRTPKIFDKKLKETLAKFEKKIVDFLKKFYNLTEPFLNYCIEPDSFFKEIYFDTLVRWKRWARP